MSWQGRRIAESWRGRRIAGTGGYPVSAALSRQFPVERNFQPGLRLDRSVQLQRRPPLDDRLVRRVLQIDRERQLAGFPRQDRALRNREIHFLAITIDG